MMNDDNDKKANETKTIESVGEAALQETVDQNNVTSSSKNECKPSSSLSGKRKANKTATGKDAASIAKILKTMGTTPGKENEGKNKAKNSSTEEKGKRKLGKTVDKLLRNLDIEPADVSCCLKAAFSKGHINFNGKPSDLDQIVIHDFYDDHEFKVTVKDLLYQPDHGGDYEEGSEAATATCCCCDQDDEETDEIWKAYVTQICTGNPRLDSGKFHNHCNDCKGFGKCLGDYRDVHCEKCGRHYWAHIDDCFNCNKQAGRGGMGYDMWMWN